MQYTVISFGGNGQYEQAISVLDKAIEIGWQLKPIYRSENKEKLHKLVSRMVGFPGHILYETEPIYGRVTCSAISYHPFFLLYSSYLKFVCIKKLNLNTSDCVKNLESVIDELGFCFGKHAVLGIVYISCQLFEKAKHAFMQEIEENGDFSKKKDMFQKFVSFCKVLNEIKEISYEFTRDISNQWLEMFSKIDGDLIQVSEKYPYFTLDVELLLTPLYYISSELVKNSETYQDISMPCHEIIYKECESDCQGGAIIFNYAMLFQVQADSSTGQVKTKLLEKVLELLERAKSLSNGPITILLCSYADALFNLGRYKDAFTERLCAFNYTDNEIQIILKNTETPMYDRKLLFYLNKIIIPQSAKLFHQYFQFQQYDQAVKIFQKRFDIELAVMGQCNPILIEILGLLPSLYELADDTESTLAGIVDFCNFIMEKCSDEVHYTTFLSNAACFISSHENN